MRNGIIETFVITALFSAAIAVLATATTRESAGTCSVSADAAVNRLPVIYTEPLQSRRLEE